jgi:hypothetical protein
MEPQKETRVIYETEILIEGGDPVRQVHQRLKEALDSFTAIYTTTAIHNGRMAGKQVHRVSLHITNPSRFVFESMTRQEFVDALHARLPHMADSGLVLVDKIERVSVDMFLHGTHGDDRLAENIRRQLHNLHTEGHFVWPEEEDE